MIDERKIEEAQDEIFEDKFLFNGTDVIYEDGDKEELYDSGQVKAAISLGAKWMQDEFLKDLWHDVDEMPKMAKAFIFECGDNSMNYNISMMFNPNDYKKNAERWHMNRWCYLEDILPKQKGGNQ